MLKKFGSLPIQFDLNLRGVYDNFLWEDFHIEQEMLLQFFLE